MYLTYVYCMVRCYEITWGRALLYTVLDYCIPDGNQLADFVKDDIVAHARGTTST